MMKFVKKKEVITNEERVKLLEERREKGEISEETYNQIKSELSSEKPVPVQTPPPTQTPPPAKAGSLPSKPVIIAVVIIAIIILGAAVSGMFGGGGKSGNGGSMIDITINHDNWEDGETITGSISGGGPGTFMPDEIVNFEVAETVIQIDIELTWSPQDMDLDLSIEDPEGNLAGSSGEAPGVPETISIRRGIIPGTWTAIIDPFAAVSVQYTLDLVYTHESINITGIEGDLLFYDMQSFSEGSGNATDSVDVEEGYNELLIQSIISSSTGSINIDIKNPEDVVKFSTEVSGKAETIVDQKFVNGDVGQWNIEYTFEGFNGTVTMLFVGLKE